MEFYDIIVKLVDILSWPATVLILANWFLDPINKLIEMNAPEKMRDFEK